MKGQIKLIVVAITGVIFMAIMFGILSAIKEAGSVYMRKQVCKLSALVKYYTDIKARMLEKVLPFGIFVTSETCNIEIEMDTREWIRYLHGMLSSAYCPVTDSKGNILYYTPISMSKVMEVCEQVYTSNGVPDIIKKYAEKRNLDPSIVYDQAREACDTVIFYLTLATQIYDTYATFASLQEDVHKTFCAEVDTNKMKISNKAVYEASVNRALELLYGSKLKEVKDYKGDPLANDKIATDSHLFQQALKFLVSIAYMDDEVTKRRLVECINNLKPTFGKGDKIWFDRDPLPLTTPSSKVCVNWIGSEGWFKPGRYVKVYIST